MSSTGTTAVTEVSGVQWTSSKSIAEAVLSRRPGVLTVDMNPVSQTATVTYDPDRTSVVDLSGWVRDCGYHCAGQSVPDHVCDPMTEPSRAHGVPATEHGSTEGSDRNGAGDQCTVAVEQHPNTDPGAAAHRSPQDTMGHGGHGAGMSMHDMVRDMRNRFVVDAVLSVPVLLWSPIGRDVLGFGMRPVRAPRRRVRPAAVTAGNLLLGVDLLRQRLPGAEGPHPWT